MYATIYINIIHRAIYRGICICVYITGWRRPIGCLKLQAIFRKIATNYRALLRRMTSKDKASYGSSTPCTIHRARDCPMYYTRTYVRDKVYTRTYIRDIVYTRTYIRDIVYTRTYRRYSVYKYIYKI